jgi:predicted phosphohydrolase
VGRLEIALEMAEREQPDKEKIVMLHYPPITPMANESGFMDLMKKYGVKLCVYGHLHGRAQEDAIEGNVDGIELRLVSCDAVRFCPVKIWN